MTTKMLKISLLFIFLVHLTLFEGLELPSYFKKCSRKDPNISDCIMENVNSSWKTFSKGDEKYHLHAFDPLVIPHMHVEIDVNMIGNFTNGIVTGMGDTIFKNIKADINKRKFEILYSIPKANVVGGFQLEGKLLSVPITGEGNINITFENILEKLHFSYKLVERKGRQYINIHRSSLQNLDIGDARFQIDFINNEFGETINQLLNTHWRDIKDTFEAAPAVESSFSQVIIPVLNLFFEKVPYDKLFTD